MKAILYYVHDPMCSWCWGFSQALSELLEGLPKEIEVRRILGGLAADSDIPMPANMQGSLKGNWSRIEESISGVKFNFDFWSQNTPKRSTYPACRAVIAAREQGKRFDKMMTAAIQRAYYKQARNPSENLVLLQLAEELDLEMIRFSADLNSNETEKKLQQEISLSQELYIESYPSLAIKLGSALHNIDINYNSSHSMHEEILLLIKEYGE